MNANLIGLTVWLTLASTAVMSQGFAGLGQAAEGYAAPTPERSFPFLRTTAHIQTFALNGGI